MVNIKKYSQFLNEELKFYDTDIREISFSNSDAFKQTNTVDDAIEKLKKSLTPYIIQQFIHYRNINGLKDALDKKYITINQKVYRESWEYWTEIITYSSEDNISMVEFILDYYKNNQTILTDLISDKWLSELMKKYDSESYKLKCIQLFEKYGYIVKNMNVHSVWNLMEFPITFEYVLDKGAKTTSSMLQGNIRSLEGRKTMKKEERSIIEKMLKNGAKIVPYIRETEEHREWWYTPLKKKPDELAEMLYRDADEKYKDTDDVMLWKDFLDYDKANGGTFNVPKWFRDKWGFFDEFNYYTKVTDEK